MSLDSEFKQSELDPPDLTARSPSRHDGITNKCPVCGSSFVVCGRRTYCCDACKSLAYRRRHAKEVGTVVVPKSQVRRAITVYECNSCGERSLGEQRCEECNTFMAKVGVGGYCPYCSESVAVSELLSDT